MDGLHDGNGRISFTVNGEAREVACAPSMRLSEVLRESLALRATKVGCNAGDCGACTVLLDGDPVCAALYLPVRWRGALLKRLSRLPARIGRCQRCRRHFCVMARHSAASAPRA